LLASVRLFARQCEEWEDATGRCLDCCREDVARAVLEGDQVSLTKAVEARLAAFDALVEAHTKQLAEIIAKLDFGLRELGDSNWVEAERMLRAARNDLSLVVSVARVGGSRPGALARTKGLIRRIGRQQSLRK
jgi:hypothetical protein